MTLQNEKNIDEIDFKILAELQKNARMSSADVARAVGLSRPAVVERLKRLEESQVIEGYQAKINLKRVGLPITAFLRIIVPASGKCEHMLHLAEDIPEMIECHRVAGEDDLLAKVVASSIEHLRNVIDRVSNNHRVITMIVMDSAAEKQTISEILAPSNPSLPKLEEGETL